MKKIVFKKNRLWEYEWGRQGKYVWRPFTGSLLHHFGNPVDVESGILFGTLLEYIINDENSDGISQTLHGSLTPRRKNDVSLLDKIGDVLKQSPELKQSGMSHIEICAPMIEIKEEEYPFPVHDLWDVHGMGVSEQLGDNTKFGIEGVPVCDLKNFPVHFKPTIEIYDVPNDYPKSGVSEIGTRNMQCRVWTLIYSIISEITFFGVVKTGDELSLRLREAD